jgi:hypothetical protein
MMKTLNDEAFTRRPEMIRALVPACVSLQIPVKMGMKLVAQTAALFWSVDHVFCNFEVGMVLMIADVALFLSQWLRSVERDGTASLNTDEARIVSLLRDLLFEADPDAHTSEPMSALLLTVWADQFDGVNVWGSMSLQLRLMIVTASLAKIFKAVAVMIKSEASKANGSGPMDGVTPSLGLPPF